MEQSGGAGGFGQDEYSTVANFDLVNVLENGAKKLVVTVKLKDVLLAVEIDKTLRNVVAGGCDTLDVEADGFVILEERAQGEGGIEIAWGAGEDPIQKLGEFGDDEEIVDPGHPRRAAIIFQECGAGDEVVEVFDGQR
jgi:hypothetical protein